MASHTRSTPSRGAVRGETLHLLTNRCLLGKLRPKPRTSNASSPSRAFQIRNRGGIGEQGGQRAMRCERVDDNDGRWIFLSCVTDAPPPCRRERAPPAPS